MPTATRTEHLTLGGLLLATTAIDAHDWHELMGSSRKRGGDVSWVRARRGLQTAVRERRDARKRGTTGRARDQLRAAERRLEELADEVTRR